MRPVCGFDLGLTNEFVWSVVAEMADRVFEVIAGARATRIIRSVDVCFNTAGPQHIANIELAWELQRWENVVSIVD